MRFKKGKKFMKLKNGTLIKLSKITKLSVQALSDYAGTNKRPTRNRAVLLEKAARKMGVGIPAVMWLYGSGEEIKNKLNRARL